MGSTPNHSVALIKAESQEKGGEKVKKLSFKVTQMIPVGQGVKRVSILMDCIVKEQEGDDTEVANMLLEAEQLGNAGRAKLHLFTVE